jgi:hypothetical protein
MIERKTLTPVVLLACSVLVLAVLPARADDKDKTAPSGAWVLQGKELKIEFADKDVMKIFPHGENNVIVVVCQYKVEKKGLVKAKITELAGKEKDKAKEILPIGLAFDFTWQVKDGIATIGDLQGKNVELLKSHLEGSYEPKK